MATIPSRPTMTDPLAQLHMNLRRDHDRLQEQHYALMDYVLELRHMIRLLQGVGMLMLVILGLTLYGATSNYERIKTLEKHDDNSSHSKP